MFSTPELNSQIHILQAILQTATAFMDSRTNRKYNIFRDVCFPSINYSQ